MPARPIPEFDDIRVDMPVDGGELGQELVGMLEEGAAVRGVSLEEQVAYELEVARGLRFPDPGDTRMEAYIREHHRMREWSSLYLRFHVRFVGCPRPLAGRVLRYFPPLYDLRLHEVTRRVVHEWFHAIGQRAPYAANNALAALRNLFNVLIDWEIFEGKNPCVRHKQFRKVTRSRFVRENEMPWLLASLAEEMPRDQAYFLLLLLTGARRDEARRAKWADMEFGQNLWHKPTTKSGQPHTVPLPPPMVERLRQLPRLCEWVFPSSPNPKNGYRPGLWSVVAVEKAWRRIRRRAGLPDLRIHDLRRSAASWLAIEGTSLSVIQSVLNHSSLGPTHIYARLSLKPVKEALDQQAERMLRPLPAAPAPPPGSSSQERDTPEWPG